jgi:hypothetical protein
MQSVEYVHGWWVLRACGRNPLVRGIDRLELVIVALGILVVLAAAAGAGALGTAQTRHAVIARAIDDSTIVVGVDDDTVTRVNARWQVDGTEHAGSLKWGHAVKSGDPLTIWVDRDGNRVDAPTPTSRAGVEAVGVAYAAWQTVALAAAGLICWGRARLDRRRDSAWERDIRCLVDDDGGRTNRKP